MKPSPRILLVEDDATSRAFLAAAVQRLSVQVDPAASLQAAVAFAARHRYAAWLIDAHLPDGSGIDALARLRESDRDAVALAHTASRDAQVHARLREAGFRDVLVKPLPADAVADAVRAVLGEAAHDGRSATLDAGSASPPWDEAAALRALNGNAVHVAALRALFVAELPELGARIRAAADSADRETLRGELHKLRASCGFVGALHLGDAARMLHRQMDEAALSAFEEAMRATLARWSASHAPASPSG